MDSDVDSGGAPSANATAASFYSMGRHVSGHQLSQPQQTQHLEPSRGRRIALNCYHRMIKLFGQIEATE